MNVVPTAGGLRPRTAPRPGAGWILIAVFLAMIALAVVAAASEASRLVLERSGGAPLIGALTPAEYSAILQQTYETPVAVVLRTASTALWAAFALGIGWAARNGPRATRRNTAAVAAFCAALLTVGVWVVSLAVESHLVDNPGFEAFWTWWFWVQAAISCTASAAVLLLALSLSSAVHPALRLTVIALASLCMIGAVTVEVPPVGAVFLAAILGVGLLIRRRTELKSSPQAHRR